MTKQERRKNSRIHIDIPVSHSEIKDNQPSENKEVGRILDLSLGGIRLESDSIILSPQLRLILEKNRNEACLLDGEVVYCRAVKPGTYHCGIQFLNGVDRIKTFVMAVVKQHPEQPDHEIAFQAESSGGTSEKRETTRVSIDNPLSYYTIEDNKRLTTEGLGRGLDLSLGGLRFESFSSVPASSIRLMSLDVNGTFYTTDAKIVYCQLKSPGLYQVGVRFTDAPDQAKQFIRSLVESYCQRQGVETTAKGNA